VGEDLAHSALGGALHVHRGPSCEVGLEKTWGLMARVCREQISTNTDDKHGPLLQDGHLGMIVCTHQPSFTFSRDVWVAPSATSAPQAEPTSASCCPEVGSTESSIA
jgi:hypothetical protein